MTAAQPRTVPGTLAHPGPQTVPLPRSMADAILAHAHAEAPDEACGLVFGTAPAADGGTPLRYVACRNERSSPTRYAIHADDLLRLTLAAEDAGEAFWGIVHSHVHTAAVPSRTDVERATYPDALYLVVSLARDAAPPLRAWRIVAGTVHEVGIEPA